MTATVHKGGKKKKKREREKDQNIGKLTSIPFNGTKQDNARTIGSYALLRNAVHRETVQQRIVEATLFLFFYIYMHCVTRIFNAFWWGSAKQLVHAVVVLYQSTILIIICLSFFSLSLSVSVSVSLSVSLSLSSFYFSTISCVWSKPATSRRGAFCVKFSVLCLVSFSLCENEDTVKHGVI